MKKLEGHNSSELFGAALQTLNTIKEYVDENSKCEIKGNYLSLFKISLQDIMIAGICKRRRITTAINRVHFKPSVHNFNRFLWFTYKVILNSPETVRIIEPKHDKIQELKKKWKEAQAIADNLHTQYVNEKGDYYK